MSVIFEVRWRNAAGHVGSNGSFLTESEALDFMRSHEERMAELGRAKPDHWIEQIDTTGCFELPSRPTPRDRYSVQVEGPSPSGWPHVTAHVLREGEEVAHFERNYRMLGTFEPFRQGDRDFALISPDYTATSVMDLGTGEIIASEQRSSGGFCPAGFYVPDWWDVHDGHVLPGSMHWQDDSEWPSDGAFGFVWGCVWADTSSWKVQYLDLSRIQEGVIHRDDRFGYLPLGGKNSANLRELVRLSAWEGDRRVEFQVAETFDIDSGAAIDPLDL